MMSGSEFWRKLLLLLAGGPGAMPIAGAAGEPSVKELLVAGVGAVPDVTVRAGVEIEPGVVGALIVGPGVGLDSPKMLPGTTSPSTKVGFSETERSI